MLPVGPASRRSSPQGKRPTSQAKPCRRGSRRRRASPLGVLKQPKVLGAWSEVWTYSRAGEVHSNLAGARDIERRAIPKCAMPAVPPPAWKLGFDQPCRSVNRARYIRGHRAKRILELGVEFRQATESGLDLVQKFPHRRRDWGNGRRAQHGFHWEFLLRSRSGREVSSRGSGQQCPFIEAPQSSA